MWWDSCASKRIAHLNVRICLFILLGEHVFPVRDLFTVDTSSKEVDILKRNNEFVFPCRTGEIVQAGIHRCVQSGRSASSENLNKILEKKRRSPISGV